MLKIRYFGDSILRTDTEDVVVNGETIKIAEEMYHTMMEYKGIGLAAPQVGISKKIIVIKYDEDSDPVFYFNLKITEYSEEKNIVEEGCLSLPGIYEEVVRPEAVTFEYDDIHGKHHVEKAEGVLARVVQHEGDHLYKTLFIDKISDLKRGMLKKKLSRIKKGIIDPEYLPEGEK